MTLTVPKGVIARPQTNPQPDPNENGIQTTSASQPSLADAIREALQGMPQCQPGDSKDQIRAMHQAARERYLADHESWISNAWRRRQHRFADGKHISPESISPRLIPVETTEDQDLFRLARCTWSIPYSRGYGRRLRFLIVDAAHDDAVMAILGLQSPPIDFVLRDRRIDYPQGRKVELVNQTMDIFTLGAVPPYNQLLAGKLAVYAAASKEVRLAYQRKYRGTVTAIDGQILPAHLVLLTTTSAFGRSSLYNRIKYQDRQIAERLGETTGYGNLRLNTVRDIYPQIREFLIQSGYGYRMGFGKGGPKETWRNITQVMLMLGIKGDDALHHGIKREAWAIPLATNAWQYLSGEHRRPKYHQEPFKELQRYWRERWLMPRAERANDWRDWSKEQLLESIIPT